MASTPDMRKVIIVLLGSMTCVVAYPNFIPTSVCDSMFPSHDGASAQTSASPYTLGVAASCYNPGQPLTVTLSGVGSSTEFRGFMMTARVATTNSDASGTFNVNGDSDSTTMRCFGRANSAVAHTRSNRKMMKTFQWTPSASLTENVAFVATVVRTERTFWMNVRTTVGRCTTTTTTTTTTTKPTTTTAKPTTTPPSTTKSATTTTAKKPSTEPSTTKKQPTTTKPTTTTSPTTTRATAKPVASSKSSSAKPSTATVVATASAAAATTQKLFTVAAGDGGDGSVSEDSSSVHDDSAASSNDESSETSADSDSSSS